MNFSTQLKVVIVARFDKNPIAKLANTTDMLAQNQPLLSTLTPHLEFNQTLMLE